MITAARVEEILSALAAAGPEWPAVAKKLPEFHKLSMGVESGIGVHRPYVWLHGEYEGRPLVPARLVLHESGVWFQLGTTAREIERRAGWQSGTLVRRFRSSTPSGWSGGGTTSP